MLNDLPIYLLYAIPILIIYAYYLSRRSIKQKASKAAMWESIESGMTTPPTLHPEINTRICIGCEACVHACPEFPEHQVLGVINHKAILVSPTDCIGHGACKAACPVDAIALVFGTSENGVDIPTTSKEFETNISGIYIAGELGGMGLIKNAVTQGAQAIDNIHHKLVSRGDHLDVAIVGAGPAGFAATLAAQKNGMRYATFEQETLGGTVASFPRRKLVMTAPAQLPIYGEMKFRETDKETLIEFWRMVEAQTAIKINYKEKIENIDQVGDLFELQTDKRKYRAKNILLAIGRRGTPRKLDIPGEDKTKVVYSMIDPSSFAGEKVMVVGGGDSALEAAGSIAQEIGTTVILSYRSAAFTRAKRKNRQLIEKLVAENKLTVMFNSQISEIHEKHVSVQHQGETSNIDNDSVIVCVGGVLPTGFLKGIGIEVETKYGSA